MTTLTAKETAVKWGDAAMENKNKVCTSAPTETAADKSAIKETDELFSSTTQANCSNGAVDAKGSASTDLKSIMESLQLIQDLDLFLITAPVNWHETQVIRRYFLNKEEGFVSCVYWNNLYFITGTDIVRCIAYKMGHIGRKIVDRKKFEEGIFSDLRALKCGTHAVLENSRSQFLKFLHRNQCLKTQKKQKVFFWFSVPHNKLFSDVLERDLKRELSNQKTITEPTSDFYKDFQYDQSVPLLQQLSRHYSSLLGQDVSHLLLKSSNMFANTTNVNSNIDMHTGSKLNFSSKTETNSTSTCSSTDNKGSAISDLNIDLEDDRNTISYDTPSVIESNDSKNHVNRNSEDFPLDFLDSADKFVQNKDENYSYATKNGISPQAVNDENILFSRNNLQYQIYEQLRPISYNSNEEPSLNYYSQSAIPSQFLQQPLHSKQSMYIVSSLPSAVDPSNTISNTIANTRNQNSGSASNFMPQLLPITVQHPHLVTSPSTILINNESQNVMDHMFLPTNDILQNPNINSLISPSNSMNTATYLNLPSSGLIPLSLPLQSATIKMMGNLDDSHKLTSTSIQTSEPNKEESSSNVEVEVKDGGISEKQQERSITDDGAGGIKTQNQQHEKQQDYMMLRLPSFSNTPNRMNFGIVGGQLFTPVGVGMECNFDNAGISTGMGISPVIGFNNGMLSAIQYQSNPSVLGQRNSNSPGALQTDTFFENEKDSSSETIDKKLDRRFQKDHNKNKVSKPAGDKPSSKIKFLNPTLQHLQLESFFDEEQSIYSDDEREFKQENEKEVND